MTLSNKDLKFRFYSVLKDEDAPPFLSDNLIAVADGLGGSGSTVHKIDYAKYEDFGAEIFRAAFSDLEDDSEETLGNYVSELMESMADGKDDTSALWASRIVIARLVDALSLKSEYSSENLPSPKVRAELSEFVKVGLRRVARRFGLESGRLSGQILLPTTVTAIRSAEEENFVRAEVLWVGDSRAYAFTKDGLKLLSVDDEDRSGCVTNIFDGREDSAARINYRVYRIPKPCILMAVSDGVFDPFEPYSNMGVENLFLSVMSGVNSAGEMSAALSEIYGKIHSDDATVSFKAYGFSSFEEMKQIFSAREKYVTGMFGKLADMKKSLETLECSEDDVSSYVRQRTEDKYPAISKIILDKYLNEEEDIVLGGYVGKRIAEITDAARKKKAEEDAEDSDNLYSELIRLFADNPDKLRASVITEGRNERECILIGRALKRAAMLVRSDGGYKEKYAEYQAHLESRKAIRAEILRLIALFTEQIESISASVNKARLEECQDAIEKCNDYNYRRSFWQKFLIHFDFERTVEKNVRLSSDESRLFSLANSNTRVLAIKRQELFTQKNMNSANKEIYESDLARFIAYVKSTGTPRVFFVPEIAEALSNHSENGQASGDLREITANELKSVLANEARNVIDGIIEILAEKYDAASAVDSCYNATRLESFRRYYRMKNTPREETLRFRGELEALNESYVSLISAGL